MQNKNRFGRLLAVATFLFAAAGLAGPAWSQVQCTTANGVKTCTVPSGTPGPVSINNSDNVGNKLTIQSSASYQFFLEPTNQYPTGQNAAALFGATQGTAGGTSSSAGTQSGDVQQLTLTNTAGLSVTLDQDTASNPISAILAQSNVSAGGNASDSKHNAGAGGNVAGTPSLTNSGTISMSGINAALAGGAALLATSKGGNAGSVEVNNTDGNGNPSYKGGESATGGQGAGASVFNSGGITVSLSGAKGFSGIAATGYGGNSGSPVAGGSGAGSTGAYGGGGGTVAVTNSAPVTVTWSWTATAASDTGAFGILAQSTGGNGSSSYTSKSNGGAGGAAQGSTITLTKGGDVTLSSGTGYTSSTGNVVSAGVAVRLLGAAGGAGYDSSTGGVGGDGGAYNSGTMSVQITDASVKVSGGNNMPAILAQAIGGNGGSGGLQQDHSNGGNGGNATNAYITVAASTIPVTVSSTGATSPGLIASSQGGVGGAGTDYQCGFVCAGVDGGNAGAGGNASSAAITLSGNASVTTQGNQSAGLIATSVGGNGGKGGDYNGDDIDIGSAGPGGAGGAAGSIAVTVNSGVSIRTQGSQASGIIARSVAGNGGAGGFVSSEGGDGPTGGAGGSSSNVVVSVASGTTIATAGSDSHGIVAQSLSGAGGAGGQAEILFGGSGGAGGAGGSTGTVSVTSGGTITTQGASARGIVAQALSGAGGSGNSSNGIFYAGGGNGGSSGSVGAVSVTNNGAITTGGQGSQGILLQSIAGGGGAAGQGDGTVVSIGGTGGSNPVVANSGSVTVGGSGGVTTTGSSAIAILAQSVGGGGGDGGGTTGAIGIGGSGAGGGAGGSATASLGAASLRTSGDLSAGLVLQSIGGGGGNGGNATGVGIGVALDIGGTGAGGGAGGTVSYSTAAGSSIVTAGSKSAGVVAQSIGGGGGTGGSAYATSVSPGVSAAVAVGGSGSAGGAAGQISASLVGGSIATGQTTALTSGTGTATNLLPVDTYGAVFQSIGGGGGNGGSATANAVAISVPVTPNVQVAVAGSASVGGKGGAGGSGGAVAVGLQSGQTITTAGQGGHGLVAQSIGGGGGIGGDSSSLSAALGYGMAAGQLEGVTAISLTPTFSLGGSGGIAGGGSTIGVGVALGGTATVSGNALSFAPVSSNLASSITTYGDYADGILAQSIGGGGGNAGFGSGNTQAYGAGSNVTLSVTLGSSGGAGGTGGPVTVNIYPGNSITTYGSGAIGVVAQSIAGGGGASQGGSYTLGVPFDESTKAKATLSLGGVGAGGGTASSVNVQVGGAVTTSGGGAYGVLAQSIGGGGGLGGSPGSDGSADNPVLQVAKVREFVTNAVGNGAPTDYTYTLALGGSGGAAGSGGTVTVGATANIATKGDWANAIVAQSVGGGGGAGGTAVATGNGGVPEVTINLGDARGGAAGSGGNGGVVQVTLGAVTLSTQGFGAPAIVAQSVGGGGGMAGDGSDTASGIINLGSGTAGVAGAGAAGNLVTVTATGTKIVTAGEQSHGLLLQSLGGGGGIAGTGSHVVTGTHGNLTASLGGSVGSASWGSNVTLDNTTLQVQTSGLGAVGVLAQSVGGGGGIATGPSSATGTAMIAGSVSSGQAANAVGGTVTIGLNSGSTIATSGAGAHGILAQSVGGGGGIAGVPGTAPLLSMGLPSASPSYGNGGSVLIVSNGSINVTGAGAVGILAQSVGGGGGIIENGNTTLVGTQSSSTTSTGGTVTVTANAINAGGANGVGIFAQSQGSASGNGTISVNVNGLVQAAGIAVQTDGGSASQNLLTVASGGTVSSNGIAVQATGRLLNITNSGTIQGSTLLSGGSINNLSTATLATGAVLQGSLVNTGLVAIGGRAAAPAFGGSSFVTTTVSGSFTQGPGGVLRAGVDFNTRQSDTLVVQGTTQLGGTVKVLAGNVLPQVRVPVLIATGGVTGQISGASSTLYAYDTQVSGSTVSVTARATGFNLAGLGVGGAGAEVAQHLTSVFNTAPSSATSPALGTLFGTLGQLADAGGSGYAAALNQLAPGTMLAFASRRLAETSDFADQLMSCPSFQGADALLTETGCAWARTTYRSVQQSSGGGYAGFGLDTTSFRLGGQAAFSPGWFAGAAVGYDQSWLKGSDNAKGNGGAGYLGVSLKREWGGWQFAAALFGSLGDNNTTRVVSVPNFQSVLRGSPGVDSQGLRLRVAYTQAYDMLYVRPSVSLDVIRVHAGAFQENGQSTVGLALQDTDQISAVGTALVELGTRSSLWGGELRRYVQLGVSVPSNTRFSQPARLVGAASSADWFNATTPMSGTSARLGLGVQFVTAGNIDLRLAYDGAYSDRVTSHAATLTGALRF